MDEIKAANLKIKKHFDKEKTGFVRALKTLYGDPEIIKEGYSIVYKWKGPFYYPSAPDLLFEETDNVVFIYRDDKKNKIEIIISWYWNKGKVLDELRSYGGTVGKIANIALREEPSDIKKTKEGEEWFYQYEGGSKYIDYTLKFKRRLFQKNNLCTEISFYKSHNLYKPSYLNN